MSSSVSSSPERSPPGLLDPTREYRPERGALRLIQVERPGLERVRDLAAGGDIEVVLVHSPDRLSRKYAYQVLLIEELGRHGVETRFLQCPVERHRGGSDCWCSFRA